MASPEYLKLASDLPFAQVISTDKGDAVLIAGRVFHVQGPDGNAADVLVRALRHTQKVDVGDWGKALYPFLPAEVTEAPDGPSDGTTWAPAEMHRFAPLKEAVGAASYATGEHRVYIHKGAVYLIRDRRPLGAPEAVVSCEYGVAIPSDGPLRVRWVRCKEGVDFADIKPLIKLPARTDGQEPVTGAGTIGTGETGQRFDITVTFKNGNEKTFLQVLGYDVHSNGSLSIIEEPGDVRFVTRVWETVEATPAGEQAA